MTDMPQALQRFEQHLVLGEELHYGGFDPAGFPTIAAVYLVFDGDECLYVGMSRNLHNRWQYHQLKDTFRRWSGPLMMAWSVTPPEHLAALERLLIRQLSPRFNHAVKTVKGVQTRQWTIRLSEDLAEKLSRWAAEEHRSAHAHVVWLLERAVAEHRRQQAEEAR